MKIGQKPELPGALAQTGLAKQAKSPAAAAEDAVAKSAAGVPATTVSIAARAVSPSSRNTGDFDAAKVKSVRTAIEKGEFSVDAEAVADRMLSNAQEILSRSRG